MFFLCELFECIFFHHYYYGLPFLTYTHCLLIKYTCLYEFVQNTRKAYFHGECDNEV